MKPIILHAWAVSTGNPGLIGVYWFTARVAPYQMGCRYALFPSRSLAREYAKKVRGPSARGLFPKAKVVRVEVRVICKMVGKR